MLRLLRVNCVLVPSCHSACCAFSTVPLINANDYITQMKKLRKSKVKSLDPCPNDRSDPLIECKRKEFNHYRGQSYAKLEPVPLASTGWHHSKSNGDYFIINNLSRGAADDSKTVSFVETGISSEVVNALERQEITIPTDIQSQGIPALLSGNNALLAAETGCGKTLAYLLPVLHQILTWRSMVPDRQLNSPLAIIITPSRELSHQIMDVAQRLTGDMGLEVELLTGGRTKQKVLHPQFKPVDLTIATLGVLSKLTTSRIYNVDMVRHVVLDEADTLLDDSFIEKLVFFLRKFPFHLKRIENNIFPSGAQLTLVSATMPTNLPESLGEIIVPESLERVTTHGLHRFLPHVSQRFMRVRRSNKPTELLKLVKANKNIPMIIFSNKTPTCDWISMFLNENGTSCVNLNGDMPLLVRAGKFNQFQSGEMNVLSCTDAGSRGLDTVRARLVINYDFPLYTADYIHRSGRVGRVGSPEDCKVVSLVAGAREVDVVQKLEHSARRTDVLPSVNANVTKTIINRILRNHQKHLNLSSH